VNICYCFIANKHLLYRHSNK